MERPRGSRLDELVAATPPTRDRYVDFLRAFSILVVVVGHWLSADLYWEGGVIGSGNAVARISWGWVLTWLLQVMPVFFFVGGFSNLVTYRSFQRRGASTGEWLRTRLERLLRPSLVFLALWVVVQAALHLTQTGAQTVFFLRGVRPPAATIPFGPLWFLAVYAGVILLTPAMVWLHERFGLVVPVAMLAGSVVADGLGFAGGLKGFRYANIAFVLLLPHQLGFFYAEGGLARLPRRAHAAMAATGLAAMVLLTNPWLFDAAGERWFPGIGHYPRSLLGTEVERISNAYPPTLVYMAAGIWAIGLVMLARGPVSRWLQRPTPWKATLLVNSVIMTLFLWHMTAYLLAILLLWPLGFGWAAAGTARWWVERPLWQVVPGLILAGIVLVFGRFERRVSPSGRPLPAPQEA